MDKNNFSCIQRTFFSLSLTKTCAFSLLNLSQNNSVPIFDVQRPPSSLKNWGTEETRTR